MEIPGLDARLRQSFAVHFIAFCRWSFPIGVIPQASRASLTCRRLQGFPWTCFFIQIIRTCQISSCPALTQMTWSLIFSVLSSN